MVRLCVLGLVLLAVSANARLSSQASQKVTPVEKVISLIKKLSAQVADEGKQEAADYDKFACFCKDQADEKIYNIEKSTARIAKLTAKITELSAAINKLEGNIGDLTTAIDGLNTDIKTITDTRNTNNNAYLGRNKEITDAISALERAIAALKDTKGAQAGDTKTSLVQLQAMAVRLLELSSSSSMVSPTESQMSVLSQLSAPGKPHAYSYHSNDIIATLEDLKKTFKKNKAENDEAEFRSKSASDKEKLGKANEKKFAEKDKAEQQALSADKSDEKAAAEEDKTSENDAKNADNAFMGELTSTCETRAGQWDQRSKMRSEELTALSQALEKLEEGVQPNYAANKKLGLVQRSSKPVTGHWVWEQDKATSFLQVRGSSRESSSQVTQRVMELLQRAAGRTHSPVLSMAAVKVMASKDHFVKVRQLIHDLVAKLKADAAAEAEQQGFCATNMAQATASRDDANAKLESASADISKADAETAALNEEIRQLEKEIAENMKALTEADTLRNDANAENTKTIDDANAGKDAVNFALTTLKTFYEGAAAQLIQTKYTPPNADASGKSVADLAPASFDSNYSGSQGQSKGIIGILEVILSDFDRTITAVTAEEASQLAANNDFERDTKGDNTAKTTTANSNKRRVGNLGDNLVTLKDDKKNAEDQLAAAKKLLAVLEEKCVKGSETYAERVAAREQEIAALKEAMDILIAWQG